MVLAYVDSIVVTDLLTVTYSEENPSGGVEIDNDGDGYPDYIITPIIQDIPTNIDSKYASTMFTGYELYQNYPNPFNPTTTIIFDIPVTSQATIKVYDIQGGYIKTLVNTHYSAGSHRVVWDGTNSSGMKINSGVYFYVLNTGETRIVKKMQLLK